MRRRLVQMDVNSNDGDAEFLHALHRGAGALHQAARVARVIDIAHLNDGLAQAVLLVVAEFRELLEALGVLLPRCAIAPLVVLGARSLLVELIYGGAGPTDLLSTAYECLALLIGTVVHVHIPVPIHLATALETLGIRAIHRAVVVPRPIPTLAVTRAALGVDALLHREATSVEQTTTEQERASRAGEARPGSRLHVGCGAPHVTQYVAW